MKLLMHKNVTVAKVLQKRNYTQIIKIYHENHLPVGVKSIYPQIRNKMLSAWSMDRVIPNDRQNLAAIKGRLGMDVNDAYIKSLGVSLTDCYWFKDINSPLKWEDVNYHTNGFEDENFCLSKLFYHPDLTTNGTLEKTWKSIDGIPSLLKKETRNILTVNEVVVSEIAARIGVSCTPYYMLKNKELLWSVCPCLVNSDNTEMVSAQQIKWQYVMGKGEILKFFDNNYKKEFKNMLLLHCLTHNTDGHMKNIAVLRDATTLEYTGFAMPFDNGTCLGSYRIGDNCKPNPYIIKNDEMKDFFRSRKEILEYIGQDITTYSLPSLNELVSTTEQL